MQTKPKTSHKKSQTVQHSKKKEAPWKKEAPVRKFSLLFVPKPRPAPKAIKRSAELLYEVEGVLDARMGRYGPEYLVKWKGYAASKNQWIDELPSFFKRRCLLLLNRASWGDSWSSSSEESSPSDEELDSSEEEDSDSDSDSDEYTSDDECTCTAGTRHRRCRRW
ncbi:hypothetical protein T484DRAFT_3650244 [Baffinella frigidus]|nr:hypothetical protein T484DRAFT_3650244 [Cryptophyta sp. CCMP2293]